MIWRPPQLWQTSIVLTGCGPVADPHEFLREAVGDDAIAVIERMSEVVVGRLSEVAFDATMLHIHAFSGERKVQARMARSDSSWVGDAVREVSGGEAASAREVWARPGLHLCLGKATSDETGVVMREARAKPYRLPVAIVEGQPAEIEFVDYYAIDNGLGTMDCIGHRVIAIRTAKGA